MRRSLLPDLPRAVVPAVTLVAVVGLLAVLLGPLGGLVAYLAVAAASGVRQELSGGPVDWIGCIGWPLVLGGWIDGWFHSEDGDAVSSDGGDD